MKTLTLVSLSGIVKGGPGSGNRDHAGRPGKRGGSAPKGAASPAGTAVQARAGERAPMTAQEADAQYRARLQNAMREAGQRMTPEQRSALQRRDPDAMRLYRTMTDQVKQEAQAARVADLQRIGEAEIAKETPLPDLFTPAEQEHWRKQREDFVAAVAPIENQRAQYVTKYEAELSGWMQQNRAGTAGVNSKPTYDASYDQQSRELFQHYFGDNQTAPAMALANNAPEKQPDLEKAKSFFSTVLGGWPTDEKGKPVKMSFLVSPRTPRAEFNTGTGRIEINDQSPPGELIHEAGHWLEKFGKVGDKTVGELGIAYRDNRAAGEKPQLMSKMTGEPGWGSRERGYQDKFADPYMGKLYDGDVNHSEIVSMGLQLLYENPHGLAKADPGLFDFVVGIAKKVR